MLKINLLFELPNNNNNNQKVLKCENTFFHIPRAQPYKYFTSRAPFHFKPGALIQTMSLSQFLKSKIEFVLMSTHTQHLWARNKHVIFSRNVCKQIFIMKVLNLLSSSQPSILCAASTLIDLKRRLGCTVNAELGPTTNAQLQYIYQDFTPPPRCSGYVDLIFFSFSSTLGNSLYLTLYSAQWLIELNVYWHNSGSN